MTAGRFRRSAFVAVTLVTALALAGCNAHPHATLFAANLAISVAGGLLSSNDGRAPAETGAAQREP